MRGTLQSTSAAHTIHFSKTSTRVLCGYHPRFPTSDESPLHASESLRRADTVNGGASYSPASWDDRASDTPSPSPGPVRGRSESRARTSVPIA